MKLNAKQLRNLKEDATPPKIKRRPMYLILEDVHDTFNIGGHFRLADALAMEKIYLCGETETPPNHRIKKASVGTYKVVAWEYKQSAVEAIDELRKLTLHVKRYTLHVLALEQHKDAIPYTEFEYKLPLALVVGNETTGLSKETLKACDAIVEIPMFGVNRSLNVIVSAAIVGYHIYRSLNIP